MVVDTVDDDGNSCGNFQVTSKDIFFKNQSLFVITLKDICLKSEFVCDFKECRGYFSDFVCH